VVLVSIDTLRADHLSSWGYARPTSPQIDRLAAQGVRFARAEAPASWTLPSHVSLFTSQLPSTHGVRDDRVSLPPQATTLAELLSAAGYTTAGFVSWIYVGAAYGLGQGFDVYRELVERARLEPASGGGAAPAGQVVDAALAWLAAGPKRPFFLFVHLFDPHLDYAPPPPYDTLFGGDPAAADGSYAFLSRFIPYLGRPVPPLSEAARERIVALYDGEIRYADEQIGRLLRALEERGDDCLVILLSDHGEELGEHGSLEGHGWTLFGEVLRVPLVVRLPGGEAAGRVVDAPVTLLDVAPTVLDVLGLPAPASFQGRSLLGLARGGPAPGGRLLVAQTDRSGARLRSVRGERWKRIEVRDAGAATLGLPVREGALLFDLESDPGEQRDRSAEEPAVARYLSAALAAAESGAPEAHAPVPVELSPEERARLRALGYAQ
jgi:arylsulfatase A-like enzyme